MMPLAKLWTFVGNWFIPLGAAWAVYVRNGLTDKPAEGVGISRSYWGLAFSLVAVAVLVWSFALYVREAKRAGSGSLAPPNTTFEEKGDRNLLISWGTAGVYLVCLTAAVILFASTYAGSIIHCWNDQTALASGFWDSRLAALHTTCKDTVYFAMGSRFADAKPEPISGVNQYLLYVSDGVLALLAVLVIAGAAFLIAVLCRSYARQGTKAFDPAI